MNDSEFRDSVDVGRGITVGLLLGSALWGLLIVVIVGGGHVLAQLLLPV